MAKIDRLKETVDELIYLKGEISMYNQMLLHHNDILDKRNYDAKKVDLIRKKVNELREKYNFLYNEWF